MSKLEELIKAKGEERLAQENAKEEAYERETKEILEKIKEYYPRVRKAIIVMSTIKRDDPILWDKINPRKYDTLYAYKQDDYFFTDSWAHQIGFFGNLTAIGNSAGGACGNVNFSVTDNNCTFSAEKGSWSRECARRFPQKFEAFESRFRNFVNSQYGDGAYDLF